MDTSWRYISLVTEKHKVFVIGIGFKPLDGDALKIVEEADVIFALPRSHEIFKSYKEYDKVKNKLYEVQDIATLFTKVSSFLHKGNVVILASGDPLYFGIAEKAIKELGEEKIEILPDVSCLNIGLSIIKKPWHGITTISLHGKGIALEAVIRVLEEEGKVAVLTDSNKNAKFLANFLKNTISGRLIFFVFQKLGDSDFKVMKGTADEVLKWEIEDPHFVIVTHEEPGGPIIGLEESEIYHKMSMITKDELRAIVIHKLRPPWRGIVWDIGAGSGAISVELARLSRSLKVYAVEKGDIESLLENKEKFGLDNLIVIKGEAPECLMGLEAPHRVFIGGTGGKLGEILRTLTKIERLKVVVTTAVTVETFSEALKCFEGCGFELDVVQVNVVRLKPIGTKKGFKALNPVFVIRGKR